MAFTCYIASCVFPSFAQICTLWLGLLSSEQAQTAHLFINFYVIFAPFVDLLDLFYRSTHKKNLLVYVLWDPFGHSKPYFNIDFNPTLLYFRVASEGLSSK